MTRDLSTPIPNSYWVQPGRLLAGEYPGSMSRADAMERVQRLLAAGVTSFIDLTEEGELPDYASLLPELTERRVRHRRLAIIDHGLPDSPAHMARILDLIDSELAGGHCVYLHCRAGIGRTGTAVGCYLVRSGLSNDDAYDQLQLLWKQCARSRRWPSIPETSEQVDFVLRWREPSGGAVTGLDLTPRYEGAMIGLALGDALGELVVQSKSDASTLVAAMRERSSLRTGAHTAMTRAVGESLLASCAHNPEDQMQRYLQWTRTASATVPAELKRALGAWQWSRKPNAGTHDPKNLDPHSLPRTLAPALYLRGDPQRAMDIAVEVSRTTQQAPVVLDLCRLWSALLTDALSGVDKATLAALNGPAVTMLRHRPLKAQVKGVLERKPRRDPDGAGDAVTVTRTAIDAFANSANGSDALLHAASIAQGSPAAAALCGALAGAHYGIDSIPPEWRRQLAEDAPLRALAQHLLG
ncbi:MAG TPA: ADP-ribosylglycohydrolase family protein [Steroidobacteraceae bacterium]|nr:ADP-ribosylglycohydrolase family protein [Steroidobacteraceae bacterium]